jgi:hypothetical protein
MRDGKFYPASSPVTLVMAEEGSNGHAHPYSAQQGNVR